MDPSPYPGLEDELNRLIPSSFPRGLSWDRFHQYPRILKAMRIRSERAAVNPVKDREKFERLLPFRDGLEKAGEYAANQPPLKPLFDDMQRCLDEYKISVFAQELGTLFPVSEKLLLKKFEQFRVQRLALNPQS